MKKKITALLLICAILLSGCATDSSQSATTPAAATEASAADTTEAKIQPSGEITWLTNSAYGDVPQTLADAYMAYNPNAKITIESYSRTELMKVIDIKMGAGDDDYDVFFVDQPLVASYYWKDYLSPLNDYFTQDQLSLLTEADLNAGYVQGDLEALPLTSSSQVLMVNMDLLEQAGLSLDEGYLNLSKRLSWEELADLAQQFQQAMDPNHTSGYWGFALGQQNNAYQVLALGNSLGEKAVADDGVTVEGVLNTEGWSRP